MKRFFSIIALGLLALNFMGCGSKEDSRPLPAPESVNAAMTAMAQLQRTIGLSIIAGAPADPGPSNPFSIAETQQAIAQAQKELAFLRGIESPSIEDAVKKNAEAYLAKPSQKTANAFRSSLSEYIRLVKSDLKKPLWRELVPNKLTTKTLEQAQELERLSAQM